MRALVSIGSILAGVVTVGSCAEGREPPKVTPMVKIESDLVFTFGPDTWCTAPGKTAPDCTSDTATTQFPILWPQVKVQLQPFAIDVHEVTNLQYAYCIAAGGCSEKDIDHAGNTFNIQEYYGNPQYNDYPVVQVTWDSASEYCEFVGGRLPTQAEWERVATGGDSKRRRFPVENVNMTDFEDCTHGESVATYYCGNSYNMQRVMVTDFDFVEENGQRIYQLMGNVAEYTSDTRDSEGDITCKSGPPGDCKRVSDCAAGDVACQQNALSCPACSTAADPCYYMCDATENPESKRQTIVCTSYPAAEQPIAASKLASSTTGSRVVRGGNITVKSNDDACQMTSTFRDKVQDPSTPSPTVGFRCAKTL